MKDQTLKQLQDLINIQKAELSRLESELLRFKKKDSVTYYQFIEKIFVNMPGYISWKDVNLKYMGCNSEFAKIFGFDDRSDIIGKTDYDFGWEKELIDQFRSDDHEVMRNHIVKVIDHKILIKKPYGNYYFLKTIKLPLYENSEVIGVLAISTDITDQKESERKLTDSQNSSMHNLEYIISKMPGYIYWKNKKSEYIGCNENLAHFSHLKNPSDIIGKTDYDFEWGINQAEQFVKDDQYIMQTGKKLITENELSQKREDGKNLYVRTEKMPFYDRNGSVIGVLAIAFDITDQKELEKKLVEEKNKAEEANLVKTEFMRNMEHDIRTPLSGVWGMANYLLEKEQDETKKEYLNDVTQCAKELMDYCNSILDFSKIESGMLAIVDKKLDLETLVDKVIKIELPAARHKNVELIKDYDSNIPLILIGDRYRVRRILINLMSNAIKFTNEGHVKLKVSFIKKTDNTALVRFIVEDTGIGIPKEKQEYVFERFSRLSLSNKGLYKGIGLGLRVVKQFMHEIGGEIDLISEVGKGTQFICTIPFKIPLTQDYV